MRTLSLVQLALSVRQTVDIGGQQNAYGANGEDNVTDQELTGYINGSVAELWDILVSKQIANYSFQTYLLTTIPGTYKYNMPYDFLNVMSVRPIINGQPGRALKPFNIHEQRTLIGSYAIYNYRYLRYMTQGNTLAFDPPVSPLPAQMQVQYTQCAPILCAFLPTAWATATTTAQWALVSASVTDNQGNVVVQVFQALNSGTTGGSAPSWLVPGTTVDNGIQWAYMGPLSIFATEFDGISGWEDYVRLDAALKCGKKQERDCTDLERDKAAMIVRLNAATKNRQQGDPGHIRPGWDDGEDTYGYGGGEWGY